MACKHSPPARLSPPGLLSINVLPLFTRIPLLDIVNKSSIYVHIWFTCIQGSWPNLNVGDSLVLVDDFRLYRNDSFHREEHQSWCDSLCKLLVWKVRSEWLPRFSRQSNAVLTNSYFKTFSSQGNTVWQLFGSYLINIVPLIKYILHTSAVYFTHVRTLPLTVFDLIDLYDSHAILDGAITTYSALFCFNLRDPISTSGFCLLLLRLKIYSLSVSHQLNRKNQIQIRCLDFPPDKLMLFPKSFARIYVHLLWTVAERTGQTLHSDGQRYLWFWLSLWNRVRLKWLSRFPVNEISKENDKTFL